MIINFDKRGGGGTITVDSTLSTESTNPVQNKVITTKINEIEGELPTSEDYEYINKVKTDTQEYRVLQSTGTNTLYKLWGSFGYDCYDTQFDGIYLFRRSESSGRTYYITDGIDSSIYYKINGLPAEITPEIIEAKTSYSGITSSTTAEERSEFSFTGNSNKLVYFIFEGDVFTIQYADEPYHVGEGTLATDLDVADAVSAASSEINTRIDGVDTRIDGVDAHLTDVEQVTARALNDLNDRIPTGSTEYIAGTNIEITTGNTINVTGITSQTNTVWKYGGYDVYSGTTGWYLFQNGFRQEVHSVMSNNQDVIAQVSQIYGSSTNESFWFAIDEGSDVYRYYGIDPGDYASGCTELDTIYTLVDCGTDSSNLSNPIVVSGYTDYFDIYYCLDTVNLKFWTSTSRKFKATETQNLVYGEMPTAQDGSYCNQFVYNGDETDTAHHVVRTVSVDVGQIQGRLAITPGYQRWNDTNGGRSTETKYFPGATSTADGAMLKEDKARLDSINSDLAITSAYTIGASTSGETDEYILSCNGNIYFNHTDVSGIYVATLTVPAQNTWIGFYVQSGGSQTYYQPNMDQVISHYPWNFILEQNCCGRQFNFGQSYPSTLYFVWDTNNNIMTIQTSLNYVVSYQNVQAELISGTNIKTINNESILGSGNITISGGGGTTASTIDLSVTANTKEYFAYQILGPTGWNEVNIGGIYGYDNVYRDSNYPGIYVYSGSSAATASQVRINECINGRNAVELTPKSGSSIVGPQLDVAYEYVLAYNDLYPPKMFTGITNAFQYIIINRYAKTVTLTNSLTGYSISLGSVAGIDEKANDDIFKDWVNKTSYGATTTLGDNDVNSSSDSTILGSQNRADNARDTVIVGHLNRNRGTGSGGGDWSVLIGNKNNAAGNDSVILIGSGLTASSSNEINIGGKIKTTGTTGEMYITDRGGTAFGLHLQEAVTSTNVYKILKLSQADYDALVAGSAVDNNTLYVIV